MANRLTGPHSVFFLSSSGQRWWVLAILAFVLRKRKELLFSISAFVLLFYGTLLLYTTFSKWDAIQRGGQNYLSQFYRVSKQRNIVHIVVDHTQSSLVYEILASDLERYSEVFDGFTLFTQAAGKYPNTYPAVPFYMTGRAPSVGVNVIPSLPYTHDYIRSLLRDCSFVNTLAEKGFHTFAFQLSPLYCQGEYTACTSGPIFEGRSVTSTRMVETMRNAYRLLDVTLFQITPVTLRRHIHNDDQWFLSQLTKKQHTPSGILDLFIDSLEANDFPGSYNYFHHAGGHPPIQFDEHCQFIGTKKWNYEKHAHADRLLPATAGTSGEKAEGTGHLRSVFDTRKRRSRQPVGHALGEISHREHRADANHHLRESSSLC